MLDEMAETFSSGDEVNDKVTKEYWNKFQKIKTESTEQLAVRTLKK